MKRVNFSAFAFTMGSFAFALSAGTLAQVYAPISHTPVEAHQPLPGCMPPVVGPVRPRPVFVQPLRPIGGSLNTIDLISDPAGARSYPVPPSTVTYFPRYPFRPCSPIQPRQYDYQPSVNLLPTSGQYAYGYGPSVYSGSGLTVNGSYRDDKWNVAFHLGSGSTITNTREFIHNTCPPTPPVCTYPLFGWTYPSGVYWGDSYSTWYGNNGYIVGSSSTYGNDPRLYRQLDPMTGVQSQGQVSSPGTNGLANQAPATPPTPLELGKASLAYRQPRLAVEAFRRDIKERGNSATTLRLLSVALLVEKNIDDAVAVMRSAYRLDPKLGSEPLNLDEIGYNPHEWRALVKMAVMEANRTKSASSWLLVASLMQAEGRDALAVKMIERGVGQGLESEIATFFANK